MLEYARYFAQKAHAGQFRKLPDEDGNKIPYFVHCESVADLVAKYANDYAVAAAFLHDVIEDTKYAEEDLRNRFDNDVVDYVMLLTRGDYEDYSSRNQALKAYNEQLRKAPLNVQLIKVADIRCNIQDIVYGDDNWKARFRREKLDTLKALDKVDKSLIDQVKCELDNLV